MNKKLLMTAAAVTLSIFSASATSWMNDLPDEMKVREMSIPGAHDAAAKNLGFGGLFMGICQSQDIEGLWNAGIRAFDLRPGVDNNTLKIFHGILDTGVTLDDAFATLTGKLTADPEDFAVILMRKEKDSSDWATKMKEFMNSYDDYILAFKPELTLGECRGKIIIFTRDSFDYPKCGVVSGWSDKAVFANASVKCENTSATLCVQDLYEYGNDINTKIEAIQGMLDYSCKNEDSNWIVNHTSGYTGSTGTNSAIKTNARGCNKAMADWLNDSENPKGRAGIVLMDFAADDSDNLYGKTLTNALVERNSLNELPDDDITTGVDEILNGQTNLAPDSPIYTISGTYVGIGSETLCSLMPGVYICEGRKFFIK